MKKILIVFAFFLAFALQARAGGIIGGAVSAGATAAAETALIAEMKLEQLAVLAEWGKQAQSMAQEIEHLYNQLEHMKGATERAINNLQGVLDARSFGDFMSWFNRQLYLEREVERRYNSMNVTVGRKTYSMSEIDKIPETLRNQMSDQWANGLSEAESKRLWADLGLSPGNYMYIQTWKEREQKIAQRVRTMGDILYDELDEAAARNAGLLGQFAASNESLDINEISKDQAAILAQIEMAVREGNILTNSLAEEIMALDEKNNAAFLYNPSPLTGSNFFFPDILGSSPDVRTESAGTPFPGRR